MSRTFLGLAALAAFALPAWAEEKKPSEETLIQLTVQPRAAPRPALRYLLLPELKEMNPGNPIPNYLKCILDQQEVPEQEALTSASLRQADWAARLDKPDWQILLSIRSEGVNLLIPDVQKMRVLANGLKARFRAEVGLRRFDDAIRTAKTMFALSRHLGEHPTLIGDLVGIAIANIAIGPLEEMLQQPGCPNLYWALTDLPNPLVPLDKALEGERMLILAELRDLDDSAPMSPEQIKKLIGHINMLRSEVKVDKSARAWLDARTKDEKLVQAARRRLIEAGLSEERLLTFPADQVILLDEKLEFEVRRDEIMKLMKLPFWQGDALVSQIKEPKTALLAPLIPALQKVRQAQGRLEQKFALLRHIEALRMYAAEHDGKLPAKLADILVPLPIDPFTGKPFAYNLDGTTAHLRGSPPRGFEYVAVYNLHYQLTIQK